MRHAISLGVLLAAATASVTARADDDQAIEQHRFKMKVPAAWKELPDVANTAGNAIVGEDADVKGGAVAYGDAKVGVFAVVFWLESPPKVTNVRQEVQTFHDALQATMKGDQSKFPRWELSETETRMSAIWEGSGEGMRNVGRATAVVTRSSKLLAWTFQCIYLESSAKKAAAPCEQVRDSFGVTVVDKDLKPLEQKPK